MTKKKIKVKDLDKQTLIVVMLCKRVSAKKIKDKALAKKPVADSISGRAQQPCIVSKEVEYKVNYGRKLRSWNSRIF